MEDVHRKYMERCLQLARLGAGNVAPNPMVGAVLVHEDRIIGEGYHRQYGQAHAEVNCLASVRPEDEALIEQSVLYVSLEPCAHFGKTPPCADLIIRKKIPKVVVGCRDPFVEVNGKGIEKLLMAGREVITGVCEEECRELNKIFFTFNIFHRPYIILKWAQTADAKIAGTHGRLHISNEYANRAVHRWRSETSAILVGTNTALLDDPSLTTRLWSGPNPVRLVIDLHLRLPSGLHLFDGSVPTIVFNLLQHTLPTDGEINKLTGRPFYYQVTEDVSIGAQLVNALYRLKLTSVLVEGGSRLLQSFIDEDCWDEARVITNSSLFIGEGLPAPVLSHHKETGEEKIFSDTVHTYRREEPGSITTYS
jgi:diaminohydroxyphosphoribosylaminopyrimidine deaminase/5-amino-6-(5-phosphoribosylamino)uracil reductase